MRVYIETTIPGYLVARPARDFVQAARQELTPEWWAACRTGYALFTPRVALDECAESDPDAASARLHVLAGVRLLDLSHAADDLAERLLAAGILPRTAARDAAHIAVASVHEMDNLLSWS